MSSEHDYTAPPELRDHGFDRDGSRAIPEPEPVRTPAPRLALWVSLIGGVLLLLGLGYALAAEFKDDATSPVDPSYEGSVYAIQVTSGMCLESPLGPDGPVGKFEAVSCRGGHHVQVIADFEFPGDLWPGADAVRARGLTHCASVVGSATADAAPHDIIGVTWVAWVPTEQSWASGDRTGLCLVTSDAEMTGVFRVTST
jgi:hypothetical protein